MENLAKKAAYDSNFLFEKLRLAGVDFKAQTVIAGLENLMIASSKPYCVDCGCETQILFNGTGKVCDSCLSSDLRRITPRGQITDVEQLLMIVLSYDCPVERYKARVSPAELDEMVEDGTLLKLFGICYPTEELHAWLATANANFNYFPYALAG